MACRNDGDNDPRAEISAREKEFRHNSDVAELLCAVMKTGIKPYFDDVNLSKRLDDWWAEHQARDREKDLKEQKEKTLRNAKAQAISKLTEEDRKALGLS